MDKSQKAPREARKPRSRGGRGRNRDEAAKPQVQDTAPPAMAQPPAQPQPDPEAEAKPHPRHSERGHADKNNRGRDRGERNDRGRRDDHKIVGMGDHLPGFIALSFDQRRTG